MGEVEEGRSETAAVAPSCGVDGKLRAGCHNLRGDAEKAGSDRDPAAGGSLGLNRVRWRRPGSAQ